MKKAPRRKRQFKIYIVMAVQWDFEYIEVCNRLDSDDFSRWLSQRKAESYDKRTYPSVIKRFRNIPRERIWGFFRKLEDAKRSVIENWCDNFDEASWYNGAIIEAVNEGYCSYPRPSERYFFKHKKKPTRSKKCEEFCGPIKCYENIVGLTMG